MKTANHFGVNSNKFTVTKGESFNNINKFIIESNMSIIPNMHTGKNEANMKIEFGTSSLNRKPSNRSPYLSSSKMNHTV